MRTTTLGPMAARTPPRRQVLALRDYAGGLGRLGAAGLAVLAVVLVASLLAPVIAPSDPAALNMANQFQAPGHGSLLGADFFGRDIWSRLLWGGRTTLAVGFLVILLASAIGVPLGLAAGQAGGGLDEVLMRLADGMLAFPSLVLAIAIASVLGPSLAHAMLAVAIAYVPQFMRVARGQARALVVRPYVEAARAAGAPEWRVLVRHVAPNSLAPLLVQASLNLSGAILATASLGFLGLGVQPPTPEWGADVAANTAYIRDTPWPALWPGLAIVVSTVAINLVADGLVDFLNPGLRRR